MKTTSPTSGTPAAPAASGAPAAPGTPARAQDRLFVFDDLQVDPARRVLRRAGEVVPVTPKALAILVVLLERRGEVVGKEELVQRVWGGAPVSDANLTQNISSLRKALGEKAGDRRYLVTVPGQGYCFAGEVSETGTAEPRADTGASPASAPAPSPLREEPSRPRLPRLRRLRPGLSVPEGLAILAVFALALLAWRLALAPGGPDEDLGRIGPPPRTSVAVLGLRNLSGEPEAEWLGNALAEMLTTELAAGTRVRVIPRESAARVRQPPEIPSAGTVDAESLSRVRSIVGAELLVMGSYLEIGEGEASRIRIDLRVVEASRGDIVASLAEVGSERELFELVSRAGSRLRQALGLTGLSPRQARAARALQPSQPEAVRLYSEGLERLRASEAPRALELLRQASAADPGSAVIRSALSQALAALGRDSEALAEARSAVELAAGLPREERLGIEARFHEIGKEWDQAAGIYRSLWTFYPDDLEWGLHLATSLMMGGRSGEALEMIAAMRRLPTPQGEDARVDLLESRIASRLADLERQGRAAAAALDKGRRSGETLLVAQALIFQADALTRAGRTDRSLPLYREAAALARREDHPWLYGMAMGNLGLALQSRGDLDAAEEAHREALEIAERLESAIGIAAQYQLLGELHRQRGELKEALELTQRSRAWSVRIGDRLKESRSLHAVGRILAAQGDAAGAQRAFEQALEISRAIADRRGEADALEGLAKLGVRAPEPAPRRAP